jgi:hypothetical protein
VFAVRTFTVWKEQNGVPVACDTIGVDNPVFGHLDGDPGNLQEPVWLDAPDGTRLSIVWPEGFTAVLTGGGLAITDETGAIAIRAGDAVELQVSRASAAGTFDDPYYASGILIAGQFTPQDLAHGITFQGCYPRKFPRASTPRSQTLEPSPQAPPPSASPSTQSVGALELSGR